MPVRAHAAAYHPAPGGRRWPSRWPVSVEAQFRRARIPRLRQRRLRGHRDRPTSTARSSSAASSSAATSAATAAGLERGLAARRHQPVDPPVGADQDHRGHGRDGEPNHLLMRLTDEVLFQCPFIMMTEVGSAFIDEAEAAQLRDYLLKGGFLWADDFWGGYAWEWWEAQIRVLPPAEYPFVELPRDHPLFRRSSRSSRRRRSRRSTSGPAAAAAPRSAAPTAPKCTRAPSSTSTATSWC